QLRGYFVLRTSRPEVQQGRCARDGGIEGGGGRFHEQGLRENDGIDYSQENRKSAPNPPAAAKMRAMSGGTADTGDAGDEALADCGASPEVRRTAAELLPPFYRQVKRVARRERNRVGAITMQTTELAHEAYLRMRGSRGYADEAHFLRAAALAMRHALINHAAARLAEKRGGGAHHVTLSQAVDLSVETDEGLLSLNEALQRLARATPRLAEIGECRFFAGYGEEDTAAALGVARARRCRASFRESRPSSVSTDRSTAWESVTWWAPPPRFSASRAAAWLMSAWRIARAAARRKWASSA